MWSSIDLPRFFAGLGLFLYGMKVLEDALRTLSSESFRSLLRRFTSTPVMSVLGGTLTTMVLQSSSMVGLMTMAFVGAGIIPLSNAVGVIVGANLGTTITGWIVTTLGFKLQLAVLALPLMGLGGAWIVLAETRERWRAFGGVVLGLGLLLFGLDGMKTAMEEAANQADVTLLQGYPALVYLLVGAVFTLLIRSSSAAIMIILSALNAGNLDLAAAAALAIGADLGTTSTLVLGSIKGSAVKKQLALSHILFNVLTTIAAFAFLHPLLNLVHQVYGITDPLYSLVAFHSTYNALGVLGFVPFIRRFSRFLERRFVDDESELTLYINNVPASQAAEAVTAVTKEVQRLLIQVLALNFRNLKVDLQGLRLHGQWQDLLQQAFPTERVFADCYDDIKKLEGEILEFAGKVQAGSVQPEQVKRLHWLLNAARHGVYAAKSLKDIRENLVMLRHSEKPALVAFYDDQLRYEKGELTLLMQLMLGEHNQAYLKEELFRIREQNKTLHQQVEEDLFRTGLQQGADELETSTLLNVNREFRASVQNFARAVEYLSLTPDAGQD